MIQNPDPQTFSGAVIGADVGATLVKLAIRTQHGRTRLQLASTQAIEEVARDIESAGPERVGITGGGAPELAQLLSFDTTRADEFEAWRRGAREILQEDASHRADRYLLVSLGTGTSAMLVEGETVTRLGGTALGGGTLMGLGAALVETTSFDELVALARKGDRRRVDLLVSDIYRSGEAPLPGDLSASSFGKLAHSASETRPSPTPADLAHAIVGLVAENVALICNGLAAAAQVQQIVFAGSTLRTNAPMVEILGFVAATGGHEVVFLENGEFSGALGALAIAAA